MELLGKKEQNKLKVEGTILIKTNINRNINKENQQSQKVFFF